MRKTIFAEGEIYHIYNRGADKREVFADDCDKSRFVYDLERMNCAAPVLHSGYFFARPRLARSEDSRRSENACQKLVDILAFALMPNHFHLLLIQRSKGGIAAFMQKLGTAYTMFFNKKHQRTGVLFQGVFKCVRIKEESHFEGIPFYIHANPLKLMPPFPSVELEMEFLRKYKWSSFQDYAGGDNFPAITNRELLEEFFNRDGGFCASMTKYLENRRVMPAEASPHQDQALRRVNL